MTRRNFIAACWAWILGLLLLSSCGSRKMKQVSLPADFKGPKELGRIYGVKITEYDNIFYTMKGHVGLVFHIVWEDKQRKE